MFDILIVGAGLFVAVFAHEAKRHGYRCLVIDKRNHIGGNCYTEDWDGIQVHKYGAHIFRTSNVEIWNYINQFAEFNNFINSPVANYKGRIFNMPFNMNTFSRMWGISTPDEAKQIIAQQRQEITGEPTILEETMISLVILYQGIPIGAKLSSPASIPLRGSRGMSPTTRSTIRKTRRFTKGTRHLLPGRATFSSAAAPVNTSITT